MPLPFMSVHGSWRVVELRVLKLLAMSVPVDRL
jgi:hypothetical protein